MQKGWPKYNYYYQSKSLITTVITINTIYKLIIAAYI